MIDFLQRLSVRLRPFRYVATGIGALCFVVAANIVITGFSHTGDRYLIPAITGLLWSLSAYVFISTFQSVPKRGDRAHGFGTRVRRGAARGWYWLLAIVFFGTTVAAVFLTLRLIGVWWVDYH